MCGRFLLRCPPEDWPKDLLGDPDYRAAFHSQPHLPFEVRSNISPTQSVLAIVQSSHDQRRMIRAYQWGLVPHWADDRKIGASMINARSETVDEKPSFRTAFSRQRCLIPADGYYEWIKLEKSKQPMLIERPGSELFCFAGLWERNEKLPAEKSGVADSSRPLMTCTIITTAANESMAPIHDRMPVVIGPQDYGRWLDPNYRDIAAMKSLLIAVPEPYFETRPVEKVSGK